MEKRQRKGRRFGDYVLDRKLGQGGMASVYLATHKSLNRIVALKIMKPALSKDKSFVRRFDREAKVVAKLDHPNVARIYRAGSEKGLFFYAMEYVDGYSIAEQLESEQIPPLETTLAIVSKIARVLDLVHGLGIVHRDIKCSNIMLTTEGEPKLMDFGLATLGSASALTTTGTILGTPKYMSPEQALGEAVDYRTDIYALGVVLYEMLCGSAPFDADIPLAILNQHVNTPPPAIANRNAAVPINVSAVVERCLAKEPSERFASASELADALDACLGTRVATGNAAIFGESEESGSPSLSQHLRDLEVAQTGKPKPIHNNRKRIAGIAIGSLVLVLVSALIRTQLLPDTSEKKRGTNHAEPAIETRLQDISSADITIIKPETVAESKEKEKTSAALAERIPKDAIESNKDEDAAITLLDITSSAPVDYTIPMKTLVISDQSTLKETFISETLIAEGVMTRERASHLPSMSNMYGNLKDVKFKIHRNPVGKFWIEIWRNEAEGNYMFGPVMQCVVLLADTMTWTVLASGISLDPLGGIAHRNRLESLPRARDVVYLVLTMDHNAKGQSWTGAFPKYLSTRFGKLRVYRKWRELDSSLRLSGSVELEMTFEADLNSNPYTPNLTIYGYPGIGIRDSEPDKLHLNSGEVMTAYVQKGMISELYCEDSGGVKTSFEWSSLKRIETSGGFSILPIQWKSTLERFEKLKREKLKARRNSKPQSTQES
ncbi:serine/threonine protein kinase [Candidatus Hydrogenedentota bacterium]